MMDHVTLKAAALAIALALLPAVSSAQQSGNGETAAAGGQPYAEAVRLLASSPDAERQAHAVSLLNAAAEAGHLDAMFALGSLYAKGRLVGRDPARAEILYRKAVERNHDQARNALAMMLLRDADGHAEAAALLRQAADNGLPVAKANLGILYLGGSGIDRNPEKGAALIRESAEAGLPLAQHNYARLLEAGELIPANPAEAMKWYGLAARNGVPQAQYNLALMEARAAGEKSDMVEAVKWLMIAAAGSRGEPRRQVDDAIGKLASSLEPPQVADAGERANLWLVRNGLQGRRGGGG